MLRCQGKGRMRAREGRLTRQGLPWGLAIDPCPTPAQPLQGGVNVGFCGVNRARGEGVARAGGLETLAGHPPWTFSAISRAYGGIRETNRCRV